MDDETKSMKEELRRKKPKNTIKIEDLLSSGSTLLNLGCTGKHLGAFAKGRYYFFVGDSVSGKTFLTLTCLAEASINPNFDEYELIHDDVEGGALMDIRHYYGKALAKRIRPPAYSSGSPQYSETVEDFYDYLEDALERGPCIYLLDSMDALTAEALEKKRKKQKKAREENTKVSGTYGVDKAKTNSQRLGHILHKLKKTGSILIIISQTRDALSFGFEPKTFSGGHALKFYATLQLWSSSVKKLKKTVKKKPRQIGMICRIKIKKNRITGKERFVDIPIYHSHGIDDIGSCVLYLCQEKHWKKRKGNIVAPEFNYSGSIRGLIQKIEEENEELDLHRLVGKVWDEIEAGCTIQRKRRYE